MFEWDVRKAALKLKKHGVSFEEASSAFFDPQGLDGEDVTHSADEPRRLRLAQAASGRVLVIAYTERSWKHEKAIRLISARRASRKERTRYKED